MKPLKFNPILKTVVWGGDKIAPFKGIDTDQKNIGESWELSGVKGNESVVSEGLFQGRTITSLAEEFKGQLLGEKVYAQTGTEFPLLIKFIDAKGDLSIQVHPDDELAARRHNCKGKTEMWYLVDADEDAHLYAGQKVEIDAEKYVELVEAGTITDTLCLHQCKKGDVFFLPAGRVHAICSGCFIAEIQQTSDITYRIFDYNRPGLDGKPRQLHTQEAKDAIDYKVYDNYCTEYDHSINKENLLVDCKYFTTSKYTLSESFTKDLSGIDSFMVVICIAGSATISIPGEEDTHITKGETVLIPASAASAVFAPEGEAEIITSYIA